MQALRGVYRPESSSVSHHVGSGDHPWAVRLGSEHLYQLSYLNDPIYILFKGVPVGVKGQLQESRIEVKFDCKHLYPLSCLPTPLNDFFLHSFF